MERLLSVGIDLGTTTTQLVFSDLTVENRGNAFSVPRLEITGRTVRYRSEIHETPLRSNTEIDAPAVGRIVEEEYRKAGILPKQVDTGAVIITGDTARKDNAEAVLDALSDLAGDFVVSTAGPDLESILAARGAGADKASEGNAAPHLHMDIGGGTANLAVFRDGELISTGCMDVGGRVIRLSESGNRIEWITPKLQMLFPALSPGRTVSEEQLKPVADVLTQVLETAAGLREANDVSQLLTTNHLPQWEGKLGSVSFSGGVADLIGETALPWNRYGDLGVLLGKAIAQSRLVGQLEQVPLSETIRATVIGAGCQTTRLSGSTVFCRDMRLPIKNIPVLRMEGELTPERLKSQAVWTGDREGQVPFALSIPGLPDGSFAQIQQLARTLCGGFSDTEPFPVILTETDMAKALGQAVSLSRDGPILCLDGLRGRSGDYLDVGLPVGGGAALPVVIKTLAFSERGNSD